MGIQLICTHVGVVAVSASALVNAVTPEVSVKKMQIVFLNGQQIPAALLPWIQSGLAWWHIATSQMACMKVPIQTLRDQFKSDRRVQILYPVSTCVKETLSRHSEGISKH